ncbi:MAG: hypothetical protein Q8S21_06120 [Candidatus Paracaedibacteraceae bacterium]|nr:hypothetical protein [Candidatus Paracaedibacteraceae bacterium]
MDDIETGTLSVTTDLGEGPINTITNITAKGVVPINTIANCEPINITAATAAPTRAVHALRTRPMASTEETHVYNFNEFRGQFCVITKEYAYDACPFVLQGIALGLAYHSNTSHLMAQTSCIFNLSFFFASMPFLFFDEHNYSLYWATYWGVGLTNTVLRGVAGIFGLLYYYGFKGDLYREANCATLFAATALLIGYEAFFVCTGQNKRAAPNRHHEQTLS